MFDEPLPKQADLRKYAHKQANFKAKLAVTTFSRFAGALADVRSEQDCVDVALQFGVDAQRVRNIQGSVDCEATVICQRCMEPMRIHIHSDVHLGIVWDEAEARQLPKSLDPIIVGEDELVDLNEVVEDELLLAMPFVSYHEPGQCSGKQKYESTSAEVAEALAEEKKENPFNVLSQLKTDD